MNTNLHQKRGKADKGLNVAEKIVVAVKASKDIPRTALLWALTHVVQPGGCITLLVVVPAQSSGRKLWGFPRFAGDCAGGHRRSRSHSGNTSEQKCDIADTCSQMMLQLHDVYDPKKVDVKIKVISGSPSGAVAAESKRAQANWVVLDKELKQEEKHCLEELQCNIVVMKRTQPKVLRLNLVGSPKTEPEMVCPCPLPPDLEGSVMKTKDCSDPLNSIRGPAVTPSSSPEMGTPFTITEAGTSSVSSSDPGTPFISELNRRLKKEEIMDTLKEHRNSDASSSDTDGGNLSPSRSLDFHPWIAEILSAVHTSSKQSEKSSQSCDDNAQTFTTKALLRKFSKLNRESVIGMQNSVTDMGVSGNIRAAVALSRNAPPRPPPLCSICQHKAPVFGKPPRWFRYAELELATGGFSQANFLAEGGFGSVHRGVLPDGRAIAVKQHKLASSQGDQEFCSEVEVLSCAQHRNVVMLIGFCVEDKRRLLVYEYICNGSLDSHLYGLNRDPLTWSARQKIAVGAARGLRYLHEECRVGCIVHRDMRPNNILITHDFEPLVGDFGLARWQPDGDMGVDTRVIGTFGYLAPEYAQSGQITEKADVYSFGVVLVELVTGRKAVDINRPKGQQFLTEWARPLLEEYAIDDLVDPRLGIEYSEDEVYYMMHAASLCIRRDPHSRPRMSQVLRILEGDMFLDSNCISIPGNDAGSRSGRFWLEQQQQLEYEVPEGFSGKLSYETLRAAYLNREKLKSAVFNDTM
ncbi:inactive protein kinase-like protein [Cinnamomum micranthum f. kanehirae]|uniref:Inactive protein kinase-like protein n=1 Tax=Cinnamomum micranthum f. kanehirae TaxID=337451 RepID=A0A3S3NML2_9MAGN|nr:inactive protein kinase-like protein [Cinnamomum micranthum f. kanehirae]